MMHVGHLGLTQRQVLKSHSSDIEEVRKTVFSM